ncbi:DUF1330 domain-containing protein [Shimia sp. R10_1]|uniref:DUF1330 domain-containing protein n=1 Tax=Shimia sp. R10_1 TaxID=2821095 RepID=UPI001ADB314C|nr:DUF1330 domain-containing protein [Shimia sp. R10_1]MBO9473018.1 DUF1330 domain-containing protein [Shimia sp. R10_1]
MTAYAFVNLTITNPDSFEAYREKAGLALKKHGAAPLHVSKEAEVIEGGDAAPTVSVLLTFPDRAAAKAWIEDPEFAEVHALRRGSGFSNIILM